MGTQFFIDVEDVCKIYEGMSTADLLALSDLERIHDSAMRIVLWERQKIRVSQGHPAIFNTEDNADDKIQAYTDRGNKYINYTIKRGLNIALDIGQKYLSGTILNFIKAIFKIFN